MEKEKEVRLPYVASHIVKRHKWQEFLNIPINRIKPVIINIKDADLGILWSWELHFRGYFHGKKVFPGDPYIITRNPKTKVSVLWKEAI